MIRQKRLNSTQQAAKDNRLATIAIAAQKAAYKQAGGKVEQLGVTEPYTFDIRQVHKMAAMVINQ